MEKIVLENDHIRLSIGPDCRLQSLVCKDTGEECLVQDHTLSLFSVTQERPFNNEVKLSYPNQRMTFQANRIRREADDLIVGFEVAPYEAVIRVREQADYISFRLERFIVHPEDYEGLNMSPPPVSAFRLLQIPVRERAFFGQWLNVCWDDHTAVNVLATSPYAYIDAERRASYRLLTADALRAIKLIGTEAALIVTKTSGLLDSIERLEEDYDLPKGVASRRSKEVLQSSYFASDLSPENVEAHIRYAKMAGIKQMTLTYGTIFQDDGGDFSYRPEYPEKEKSLTQVLSALRTEGITPGLHVLPTNVGVQSRFVRPVADHRLNLKRHFTLARALEETGTTIYVEQNPEGTVLAEGCRILQFGGELIAYESYTTQVPYRFLNCSRGHHGTNILSHPIGQIGGILDVSEYGANHVYIDQNSSLQDEIAEKLAAVYDLGFEYLYFDGAEGVTEPYGFHIPHAQYRILKHLKSAPIYTEGAAKAHFSWHFLTGGNAFDVFRPAVFKEKIDEFPVEEAARMKQDFTRINFGWWGYWLPDTQPDQWEYGASKAAAWDCPVTIKSSLWRFRDHPRTADIFEVFRRWEDVRTSGWLSDAQKQMLRSKCEFTLLLDENEAYELVPYQRINTIPEISAFIFERKEKRWVVYWHHTGNGTIQLLLSSDAIVLKDQLSGPAIKAEHFDDGIYLPAAGRRYISTELSREDVTRAFEQAVLI